MNFQRNTDMTKFEIEEKIVDMLKTVFDPEIPVNVYDPGTDLQNRRFRGWRSIY